ncbi:MAG: PAS domain-containing sensor histidine kinase [Patescibacteria group bacterium]|nr:PAS domain-containing sensor histidine kinase [Patescibacteria group bacterium]
MNNLLASQLDLIYFINGLIFIIAGAGSLNYFPKKQADEQTIQRVNWNWFAAFAFCFGINIWMDVFVLGFPSYEIFRWINPIITGFSYFLLFNFGISIFNFGKENKLVIRYLSIILAVVSGLDETPLFSIGIKFITALIGGGLCLFIMWKSAKHYPTKSFFYKLAFLGIFLYTSIFSLSPLVLTWFSSEKTLGTLFSDWTGFPIDLIAMVGASFVAIGIWFAKKPQTDLAKKAKRGFINPPNEVIFILVALISIGAVFFVQNKSNQEIEYFNDWLLEAGHQPAEFISDLDDSFFQNDKLDTSNPLYAKTETVINNFLIDFPKINSVKIIRPTTDKDFQLLMDIKQKKTTPKKKITDNYIDIAYYSNNISPSKIASVYGPVTNADKQEMVGAIPLLDENSNPKLILTVSVDYVFYHETITYHRIIAIIPCLLISLALIFLIIYSRQKSIYEAEKKNPSSIWLSWFAPGFGLFLTMSAITLIAFIETKQNDQRIFSNKFNVLANSGYANIKEAFHDTLRQMLIIVDFLEKENNITPEKIKTLLKTVNKLEFDKIEVVWIPADRSKEVIEQDFGENSSILNKATVLNQAIILPQQNTKGVKKDIETLVPILVPIFNKDNLSLSNHNNPKGFIVLKYSVNKLIKQSLLNSFLDNIVFEIKDSTPQSNWGVFHYHRSFEKDYSDSFVSKDVLFKAPINYADRLFYVIIYPDATLVKKNTSEMPFVILFGGLAVGILLGFYVCVVLIGKHRAKLMTEKRTEELIKEKNRLETYVNISEIFVIAFDNSNRLSRINNKGKEILGISHKNSLNTNWIKRFVSIPYQKKLLQELADLRSNQKMTTDDIGLEVVDKNGNTHQLICRFAILEHEQETIIGAGIDVTELNQARVTIDQLKEFDKLKNDIINITSHEFKTPLVSIIGLSEVMKKNSTSLPTNFQQYVEIIHRESVRLNALIKKMLIVAKNEQGKNKANFETLVLGDYINSLKTPIAEIANTKQVTVEYELHNPQMKFISDRDLLSQILFNFTDNAIKYGPEKQEIIIASSQNNNFLQLSVTDQGPGIIKEKQKKLFEKFYQLDSSPTRTQDGIGLGLFICKQNSEILNGQIGLKSESGHGSTFYVKLPLKNK